MDFLINRSNLFDKLEIWEWTYWGSLDGVLGLEISPIHSSLSARVVVVNGQDGTYAVIGAIYGPNAVDMRGYDETTQTGMVLTCLGRLTCGVIDPHMTGLTNVRPVKEIYKKHRLN